MKKSDRLKQRPMLEALEDRRLLAAPIAEFPISAGSPDITLGPDGNLWFPLFDNQIGRITPSGQVTEFPIPPSSFGPSRITTGPDGNLWFTYVFLDFQVGRITPTGLVTVFPTPSGSSHGEPFDITAGSDGNLWFTEQSGKKIGRITPTGQVTEFPVSLDPGQIVAGSDGNLWFTETGPGTSMIGRITPSGQVTEFPLRGVIVSGETVGPDGNLWFTELAPETNTSSSTAGPSKRIYFLGKITPAGQISEIPLSGFVSDVPLSAFYGGNEMTVGPDGNLWYSANRNAIGRITPAGLVFEFPLPTATSFPFGIVAGPDGNLWFSEPNNSSIGRFHVATTDLRLAIPASTIMGTTGQPLSYTISVINDSPVEATDVVLMEDVPTPTVSIPVSTTGNSLSISASQGTVKQVASGGFVAEVGNLASGATATVTIVFTSARPQALTGTFTVHSNESDTNPSNDKATLTTTIDDKATSPTTTTPTATPPIATTLTTTPIHLTAVLFTEKVGKKKATFIRITSSAGGTPKELILQRKGVINLRIYV